MARLPPGYCMDLTEVTIGHYSAWIATNPVASAATQIARCASNLNFPPNPICMEDPEFNLGDEYPQSCVDWCDAYAYCAFGLMTPASCVGGSSTASVSTDGISVVE